MNSSHSSHRRRWGVGATGILAITAVALFAVAAFAIARTVTLGVGTSKLTGPSGSRTEPIAVTSRGVAVYELLPETKSHLLCTAANGCFGFWPPVKVGAKAKLTKASAIKGRLGTLKRNGFEQLTLNGHPLYTFSEDHGRRDAAAGDGLHGFGGTWHVFKEGPATSSMTPSAGGSSTSTSTTTTTTTTTSSTSTVPGYPTY